MKNIPAALLAHYALPVTTLAHLWRIALTDGVRVMCVTDHDADIVFGGETYIAAAGFTPTAVQTTSDLAVDNLDVEGLLAIGLISADEVLSGALDRASVTIRRCNYKSIADGTELLRKGWLGQVTITKTGFTAELRGQLQLLQQPLGVALLPSCNADLGDSKCGVDLAPLTVAGTVGAVTSPARAWVDASLIGAVADRFTYGVVTWLTGGNVGRRMEVKTYDMTTGAIGLQQPMFSDVLTGDTYTIVNGCDKSLSTCVSRFANAINFRGFAHIPGSDFLASNKK